MHLTVKDWSTHKRLQRLGAYGGSIPQASGGTLNEIWEGACEEVCHIQLQILRYERRNASPTSEGIRPFWSTGTVACTEPGGPEFESRTQLVVTDCELLRLEDCIFAPQSCKCYGNFSSKVE